MNDLETRLRDALAARAGVVRADDGAYAGVVTRRRGRSRHRALLAVAGTAAAVSAVVAVATVPDRAAPPAAHPDGAAAPAWLIAVEGYGRPRLYSADLATELGVPAVAGYRANAVAAVGDGRTFFVAWQAGCETVVRRVVRDGEAVTAEELPGGLGDVDGNVTELAVTRDGRRLAYGVRRGTATAPNCDYAAEHSVPELVTVDLATRERRTWRGHPGEDTRAQHLLLSHLSWAPDGGRLAYQTFDCCASGRPGPADTTRVLDTGAGDASFLAPPPLDTSAVERTGCRVYGPVFRGRHGDLALVRDCAVVTVFAVDPGTGAVVTEVFTAPERDPGAWGPATARVAFDASGDHALVTHYGIETGSDVMRWDGHEVTRLTSLPARLLAW